MRNKRFARVVRQGGSMSAAVITDDRAYRLELSKMVLRHACDLMRAADAPDLLVIEIADFREVLTAAARAHGVEVGARGAPAKLNYETQKDPMLGLIHIAAELQSDVDMSLKFHELSTIIKLIIRQYKLNGRRIAAAQRRLRETDGTFGDRVFLISVGEP
jgi:hypothetical protein